MHAVEPITAGAALGKHTTAVEALRGQRLDGRTAIVTGASSGIGVETARALAFAGAHVVLACRSVASGEQAAAALRAELPSDAGPLEVAALDLADLASVRAFIQRFLSSGRTLDLLINNAGVMASPLTFTAQGIESQLGINHVGHFALTTGLLPALGPHGRVVNVASSVHTRGKATNVLETLTTDRAFTTRRYSRYGSYDDSKLANVLFTRSLATRLAPGQSAHAIHPGVIGTNLARSMGAVGKVFVILLKLFSKSAAQGAATSVFAATAPELAGRSGTYLADCAVARSSPEGQDAELAERLWAASEQIVAAA
ncbi:MAG: retinol dehydrogenase 12-like [Deltaproteobacteria bacterium]|nr:retinol dehydrogenase 12-like [Deltaproteobacteria bacterium]